MDYTWKAITTKWLELTTIMLEGGNQIYINANQISSIEDVKDKHYVRIVMTNGKEILVQQSIYDIINTLKEKEY